MSRYDKPKTLLMLNNELSSLEKKYEDLLAQQMLLRAYIAARERNQETPEETRTLDKIQRDLKSLQLKIKTCKNELEVTQIEIKKAMGVYDPKNSSSTYQ